MKPAFILLLLFHSIAFSQKVKTNAYDKFIRQTKVEMYPLPLLSAGKSSVSMSFSAIGSSIFLFLNGVEWGASTIDGGNEVIFLFSNDSTVTARSTGLQTIEIGEAGKTYKHSYSLALPDLEALSKFQLVGIRKYSFRDHSDLQISRPNSEKIQKLSSLFIEELRKSRVIKTVKYIGLGDIASHIGDSVVFCSRVYSMRHFEATEKKPTVLEVNSNFNQPVNVVIWEENRKKFGKDPETLYTNKEVCISGVVNLHNNIPQIIIYDKEQIRMKSPVDLAHAGYFIGDTVTVTGTVFSSKYIVNTQTAPTLLNLGAAFPDQLLTVVIENKDRKNFMEEPENYYIKKEITVTGKVVLYNGKPQIAVQSRDQITEAKGETVQFTKADNHLAKADTIMIEKSETQAQFPGGPDALLNFLKANLRSPVVLEPKEKKSVLVSFLVSPAGAVTNISILESAGKLFDNEVIKVMKLMPNWKPYTMGGKAIGTVITQRITFLGLEPEKPEKRLPGYF